MSVSTSELALELERLASEFASEVAPLATEPEIRQLQAQYLGKKGRVSERMKLLGKLPPEERKQVGEVANRVKETIEKEVADRLQGLAERELLADLARSVDTTLPARGPAPGALHPLTLVRREIEGIFAELGFVVATGPQLETDFHNFEALAMPADHPARDMQDTFYLAKNDRGSAADLLRTHTSPVQIRTMQSYAPPVKIIAPGAVFRRDDDPTHSPQFMQVEGLLVDEIGRVTFADLKGTLLHFVTRYFGGGLSIRLRPSFFPFTEPSAEVDMSCVFCSGRGCRTCKGTGFIEIGGAGMVDPEVLRQVGYDSERFAGFAFGMGIDRMAMLRYGIDDIKWLYSGDVRFLAQWGGRR